LDKGAADQPLAKGDAVVPLGGGPEDFAILDHVRFGPFAGRVVGRFIEVLSEDALDPWVGDFDSEVAGDAGGWCVVHDYYVTRYNSRMQHRITPGRHIHVTQNDPAP